MTLPPPIPTHGAKPAGWWSRHWRWAMPLAVLLVLAGAGGVVAWSVLRWSEAARESPPMREAMRRAGERARKGEGGSVIEFMTYRLHDHTTADDARRYRDDAEVKDAWQREPMLRLRKYLINAGVWSEEEETAWVAECGTRVDEEVNLYLNTPVQPVEAMFDYLYGDMPADVLAQREAAMALEAAAKERRA